MSSPFRFYRIALFCLLVASIVSGLFLQASFLHSITLLFAAIYFLAPFIVGIVIWVVIECLCKGKGSSSVKAFWTWSSFVVALALSWAVGCGACWLRTEATRSYVAAMIERVDAIKRSTGSYPANLPASTPDWMYRTLGYPVDYTASSNAFSFDYDDNTGMMDEYELQSEGRTWRYVSL